MPQLDAELGDDRSAAGPIWDKWLKRFENYLTAADISDNKRKKAMLLHLVGPTTFDEFQTLTLTPVNETVNGNEVENVYETAKAALEGYFKPKVNTEFEIAQFRTLRQKKGEKIDSYHTRLRQAATTCSFADTDKEIKSHIIQTMTDDKVRKKGLSKTMTLAEILSEARNNELCRVQNETIVKEFLPQSVQTVNAIRQRPRSNQKPPRSVQKSCFHCGGPFPHPRDMVCPAKGKTCESCGKLNHFKSMCMSSASGGANRRPSGPGPRGRGRGRGRQRSGRQVNAHNEEPENYSQLATASILVDEDSEDDFMFHIDCFDDDNDNEGLHATNSDDDYLFYIDCFDDDDDGLRATNTNGSTCLHAIENTVLGLGKHRVNAVRSGLCATVGNSEAGVCATNNSENNADTENVQNVCPGGILVKPPMFDVCIEGVTVKMMADSGATCTIVDEQTYNTKLKHIDLSPSPGNIVPYGSGPVKRVGKFKAILKCNGYETKEICHVVPGSSGCLLGIKPCQALGLITIANVSKDFVVNSVAERVIANNPQLIKGVGKHNKKQIDLHIDHEVEPVIQKCRRLPFTTRKKVDKALDEALTDDLIERPDGPTTWASPIVAVPKPGNPDEVRICVDMKRANKAIKRQRHPAPTLDDLSERMKGKKKFSKVDLRKGYHQLELTPRSRDITTFITHRGLFRSKRLSFGISSASEIFQQVIEDAIQGIDGAINISDDILIAGATQEEHDRALEQTLTRLVEHGLSINLPKCVFDAPKVKFFGMIFSEAGIQPDPDRVTDILEMQAPRNRDEVHSLVGMMNYSARFIPNYSTLTAPLRMLLRHDADFVWGKEQQEAYDTLISWLSYEPVLAYFDTNRETEIIVDASPVGLGAILAQADDSGHCRVVSYGSRSLTEVEQRYSQLEREALAVVWSCEYFHIYIYGKPVTVWTDHKPLLGLFGKDMAKLPLRVERWKLRLQPYMPDIKYQKGVNNPADYLSRHPSSRNKESVSRQESLAEDYVRYVSTNAVPKAMTINEVIEATNNDATLCCVRSLVVSNKWFMVEKHYIQSPNIDYETIMRYSRQKYELSVTPDGLVLRGNQICLPQSLQQQAVQLAHVGHLGVIKTKALIREKVWFPGIDRMVEQHINACVPCKSTHDPKQREPLKMSPLPDRPWAKLCGDFYGPLPSGHYLMAILDEYSRFPEVEVISSLSARVVIPRLEKVFASRGIPEELKTDNGSPFQSSEFRDFAEDLGFTHKKVAPYWPEANGLAENFMKTLGKTIKCAQLEGKNWQRELNRFLMNYRATPHSSTGIPPATALNGHPMRIQLPEIVQVEKKPGNMQNTDRSDIFQKDAESKSKMKHYAEKRRNVKECNLEVGDKVLMKNVVKQGKLVPKFQPEPFEIVEKKGSMITAQRGLELKSRNSSHFRLINTKEDPLDPNEANDDEGDPVVTLPERDQQPPVETPALSPKSPIKSPKPVTKPDTPRRENRQEQQQQTPIRPRSSRKTILPSKYKDYVMT